MKNVSVNKDNVLAKKKVFELTSEILIENENALDTIRNFRSTGKLILFPFGLGSLLYPFVFHRLSLYEHLRLCKWSLDDMGFEIKGRSHVSMSPNLIRYRPNRSSKQKGIVKLDLPCIIYTHTSAAL
jgi:hypothetical protein